MIWNVYKYLSVKADGKEELPTVRRNVSLCNAVHELDYGTKDEGTFGKDVEALQ